MGAFEIEQRLLTAASGASRRAGRCSPRRSATTECQPRSPSARLCAQEPAQQRGREIARRCAPIRPSLTEDKGPVPDESTYTNNKAIRHRFGSENSICKNLSIANPHPRKPWDGSRAAPRAQWNITIPHPQRPSTELAGTGDRHRAHSHRKRRDGQKAHYHSALCRAPSQQQQNRSSKRDGRR